MATHYKDPRHRPLAWLTVIVMMTEKGKKLDALLEEDDKFVEPILEEMYTAGLVELKGSEWLVTPKGLDLRVAMVRMYDQVRQFEIFGAVNLARSLTDEEMQDPAGNRNEMLKHQLDPRFAEGSDARDLRLAAINFLGVCAKDKLGGRTIDPYQIVFMQKLAAGKIEPKELWFNLRDGEAFAEIDAVVGSAIKWPEVAANEKEAEAVMSVIYTAGMLEQRKRDGTKCAKCGTYLAIFEDEAKQEGRELTECPNPKCRNSLVATAPPGGGNRVAAYTCPNCGSGIKRGRRCCPGCRATLDFSLPAGTTATDTTVTEEVMVEPMFFGGYYGYTPLGYWDPWDPFADLAFIGSLCALDVLLN